MGREFDRSVPIGIVLLAALVAAHTALFGVAAAAFAMLPVGVVAWLLRRSARARGAAAADVHREREWLRTTLASMGDAVIATDAAGNVTLLNPVAEALTGWLQAEAAGRPLPQVFRIVNESTRAEVENPALRALREGAAVGLANHTVLTARDGSERPIDDSAAPIRDETGAIGGAVLVFRDIAERKRAEEAQARLAAIVESSDDAIVGKTLDGVIRYWNSGAERVFGYPAAEAIGKPITLIIPPERLDEEKAIIDRLRRGERVDHFETVRVIKGGQRVDISLTVSPIRDAHGTVIGASKVARDVTERRRAEQALRAGDARNRFLLALEAATRPLVEPAAIMAAANRVLGEHLRANRVLYFEIAGPDYLVERDYTDGVASLAGRYPVASFGAALLESFLAGRTVVEPDATTQPGRSEDERAAFAAIHVRGHVDVALVKAGAFVAGMTVHLRDAREWTADEVALIEMTAERTWAAVERARAERTLRASEARFRTLFDSMDQGFCVIEVAFVGRRAADYRFVELNPAFERHSGLPHALLGKSIREVVPGWRSSGSTPWFDTYGRVAATGEPTRFVHHAAPLGRWFEVYAFRLEDPDRHRVAVLFTDVTERKAAEERLQRSHDTFLNLIQNNPFGVYLVDADFRLARVSLGAQKVFSSVRPLLGRDFAEVLRSIWAEPAATEFVGRFRRTLATGEPYVSVDTTARRADVDGVESYDWRIERVSLPDGRHGVVCYFYDMTERRRIEDALKDVDRKKDDFIALLAHELRNPLAPIRNGLQVIRLSEDRATRDRSQRMMDRQLTHMVRMIDDLLDVSRIGRNKMDLRRARVALADVVASAVETARPAVEEAGHELNVSLPPQAVFLDADLTRLSQVLSNLLTNSAKYTERGGRIWLAAEARDDSVVVTVRDTGIGIPTAALPTLFDMFSQVDRTFERTGGGLGIGLALVKGLVEMHGGTVTARSEGPGRGSEFAVTLPVLRDEPPVAGPAADDVPAAPRARRRVLVVDDNRDGAESLAEMLVLLGNEVETAHDGVEAVERAEQFRPEVVLMDVGMPRLNGLDATKRIREHPWGRTVTVIALTGWGQEADRERSREAGCDGHLVKPVGLPDLEKLLAEIRGSGTS